MLRIVFDVPRLKAKRRELEQISAQPEFWENQEEAKKQMLILDDVKVQLELLDKWQTFIADANASEDVALNKLAMVKHFSNNSFGGTT